MTTTVEIDNPELVERKTVDDSGRIYVGTDKSGDDVEVVIRRLDDEGSN